MFFILFEVAYGWLFPLSLPNYAKTESLDNNCYIAHWIHRVNLNMLGVLIRGAFQFVLITCQTVLLGVYPDFILKIQWCLVLKLSPMGAAKIFDIISEEQDGETSPLLSLNITDVNWLSSQERELLGRITELQEEVSRRKNHIAQLDHQIHTLNENISTLTKELELKGKEVLKIRSEANQQIRYDSAFRCNNTPYVRYTTIVVIKGDGSLDSNFLPGFSSSLPLTFDPLD